MRAGFDGVGNWFLLSSSKSNISCKEFFNGRSCGKFVKKMKLLSLFIVCSLLCFTKQKKEKDYVGSTPAHGEVRDFLDISLTDSIDFIRWKLAITNDNYQLDCSYGV